MSNPATDAADFLIDLRAAAHDCADMYLLDGAGEDLSQEEAETIWDEFLSSIEGQVRDMFRRRGASDELAQLAGEVAIGMVLERLDQHAAMPEVGHA